MGPDLSSTPEVRLLVACGKIDISEDDRGMIRQILESGVDWTEFSQAAVSSGLANLAAYALVSTASELIPVDILAAFRELVENAHARNNETFNEVSALVEPSRTEALASAITRAREDATLMLQVNPNNAMAWCALAHALADTEQRQAAIRCYNRAIELAPQSAVVWKDRAGYWFALGQAEAALADIDRALAIDAEDVEAWVCRARALWSLRRLPETVDASERALALDPGNNSAARLGIQSRLFACDWRRRIDDKRRIIEGLEAGRLLISPLNHRALIDSEADHFVVTGLRAKTFSALKPVWGGDIYYHDKIRVAYLSTDFRDHAVADAIAGCFEHHDKNAFELTGISLGPNDQSAMRRRLEAAFDRFVDVRSIDDRKAAELLHGLEIDIAVDLNGYIGEPRTAIFAHRPAPIQVNYFGYPGTMNAGFIDYIIADPVVIPRENQRHYREHVVYLPNSYLPNDDKRPSIGATPTRSAVGLPVGAFVFASLNNPFKIGPEIFDVWMRLLNEIENSVLWLLEDRKATSDNLRREAQLRGIASERLVFAPRISMAEHLARQRLADLFLDTLPYNAHTTASDALWVGLPLLTCLGSTFCGRVAASALHAVGLPILVTVSLAEYERMALALARDPECLAAIRTKLQSVQRTAPLFDAARLTKDLESAYTIMWGRHQKRLPPRSFSVASSA